MATITENKTLPPTKNNSLLQMAKAIYDEVQSAVDSKIDGIESKMLMKLGEFLEKEISTRVAKALAGEFTKRLEKEFAKRIPEALLGYRKELVQLRKVYEGGQEQIKSLLNSLPTPNVQVSFPENAIEIKQLPSQVMVTVPENAIEVKQLPSQVNLEVKPADINPVINLPEQKSIINIPQQAAPQISVNVPPPRLVKKTFSYSQYGQPLEVIEKEMPEEGK